MSVDYRQGFSMNELTKYLIMSNVEEFFVVKENFKFFHMKYLKILSNSLLLKKSRNLKKNLNSLK